MRYVIAICLLLTVQSGFGSSQMPELLIIGKDTIKICQFPLTELSKKAEERFYNVLMDEEKLNQDAPVILLNLWRGYRGVWELIDGKLYLVDLQYTNRNAQEIMKEAFQENYKDGKVFADWFSERLIVGEGPRLGYDGLVSFTHEKEEHLFFEQGYLTGREEVNNYIAVENAIPRRDDLGWKELAKDEIFQALQKLDWETFKERCNLSNVLVVTIGAGGKIVNVENAIGEWNRACSQWIVEQLQELQFDIVKWQGKPHEDVVGLRVHYNPETKTLENRNHWDE